MMTEPFTFLYARNTITNRPTNIVTTVSTIAGYASVIVFAALVAVSEPKKSRIT